MGSAPVSLSFISEPSIAPAPRLTEPRLPFLIELASGGQDTSNGLMLGITRSQRRGTSLKAITDDGSMQASGRDRC
jgi:hypothetical protein